MVYAKKKKPKRPGAADAQSKREEEIVGVVDTAVNAIVERWKPIIMVLGGIAVVLGSISIFHAVQSSREDKAAALLYDAEMDLPDPGGFGFQPTDDEEDDAAREEDLREALVGFQAVIDTHDHTVQADIARLEAGHVHMKLGEFEEAEQLYAAAADSKAEMVRALALAAQATALESLERSADAAGVLREQVQETYGATRELAYLDLIRVQEDAGDTDGALATCREFETELPDSPKIDEVRAKIRALGGEPEADDAGDAGGEDQAT